MRDYNYIQSLERGLKILEILGRYTHPLTLTEIATQAGFTKTSTQRFLHTLSRLGYINRDDNKRYSLGTKILSLGFSVLNSSNLSKMAKPYMDELAAELDTTVNLAVLDNLDVLFLYRNEIKRFMKYDLRAGSKLPAYCCATGRVLLAGLRDDDLKNRIDAMEPEKITRKTTISKSRILADIIETRQRGYSVCDRQLSMDLYSVGVPLIDTQNNIVAAVNAALQIKDLNPKRLEAIIQKLKHKGEQISRILGYKGVYPCFFN